MSVAMSVKSLRDMEGGSLVSFETWDGLSEYEKLAAPTFAEGLENSFSPSMSLDNTCDGDVVVAFSLGEGVGTEGTCGPTWRFSLRNAFESVGDCYRDDVVEFIRTLRSLADFAESLIDTQEAREPISPKWPLFFTASGPTLNRRD